MLWAGKTTKAPLNASLLKIQSGLKLGVITPQYARHLIRVLEFEERKKSVLEWGKYYFPDKFEFPFCKELHEYLIEIMQDPFTCTLAPRGYAKTTIQCFLIPIFLALNYPRKFKHFLNVQATSSKARIVNLAIRHEIENNEGLRQDYGDLFSPEKWTERQFVLRNGVIFTALGSLESVRGINYKNIRPDYAIFDDIYDDDDAENIERIRKINNRFWRSFYSAMAKPVGQKLVCIRVQGTAMHRIDLLHELAEKTRWRHRKFQAVKDFKLKLVLWPEVETFELLMLKKEDMGSISFMRELQNEVRNDENAVISTEWIQGYDSIPEEETIVWKRLCVDPAVKEREINDPTGIIGIAKTNYENYYIFYANSLRISDDKLKKLIKELFELYNFDLLKGEGISAFDWIWRDIRRSTNIPVKSITSVAGKLTRLIKKQHKFENFKVFISNDIPKKHRDDLIEQLTNNYPSHDDLRDATMLGLEEEGNVGIGAQ